MIIRSRHATTRRALHFGWAALFLPILLASCQMASDTGRDCRTDCRAEFVFPAEAEKILFADPSGRLEVALGRGDMPADIGGVARATVEFSRDRGESWRPAEVEALGQVSGLPSDAVLLRAYGVPDGDLMIRGSLTAASGILYQAQAKPVTVWFTPKPKGKVTTATPTNGGRKIRVGFDGSGSTDGRNNPGGIRGWQWDFGDGSPKVTGKTATHTYQRRGKFMVVLCVTDARGKRAYKYYQVDTGSGPGVPVPPITLGPELPVWPSCKCTGMTVDRRAGVAFGPGYTTAGGTKGFVNQLSNPALRSPAVYYGFEVVAKIQGNPDKCYEWQEIRRTSKLGTTISHAHGLAIGGNTGRNRMRAGRKLTTRGRSPQAGASFGLDGYDTTGPTKLHLPGIIRWRDRPGQPGGINGGARFLTTMNTGYDYNADFLTVVGGPLNPPNRNGECACSFNVHVGVDKTGATTNNKLTPTPTHPLQRLCVFNPP